MAIEPIGSMTAVQVQSTVKIKPVETQSSSSRVNDFETKAETSATPKLDDNTAVVAKTNESDTRGQDRGREDSSGASSEMLRKAVEEMNKSMTNSKAIYGIHEGTNRVTIKIVDKDTNKVIKELPPEKTLDMITKVWEMAELIKGTGWLVDEKR